MPSRAAPAEVRVLRFAAAYAIRSDGTLAVEERITVDFGTNLRHGIFRDFRLAARCAPRTPATGGGETRCPKGYERRWPMRVLRVTDGLGNALPVEEVREGAFLRLRVGDPERTVTGVQEYRLSYVVERALDAYPSHDELYWNVTGRWQLPIAEAVTTLRVDGGPLRQVACFAGAPGSTAACEASIEGGEGVFRAADLSPGEELTIVAGWPKGSVEVPPPLLEKATTPAAYLAVGTLDLAFASVGSLAALAAVATSWWRLGRDRRFRKVRYLMGETAEEVVPLFGDHPVVVEYTPPEGLRPSLMGVLLDERVDSRDIAATVVDLAVRGHLRIREVEPEGAFARFRERDWELERLPCQDRLERWEAVLLRALVPSGERARLSEVRKLRGTSRRLGEFRKALYREAVRRGWYRHPPDQQKARWRTAGILLLAAGAAFGYALGRATGHGLLAVPVVVLGLGVLAISPSMARRTAEGRELLRRIAGFRLYIDTAERERQRFFEEANLFERYLPYAVAFGCVEKWTRAFAGLERTAEATPASPWYVATTTHDVEALASSLQSFADAVVATTAGSSGFSGGSAGGGGGGGGGGAW